MFIFIIWANITAQIDASNVHIKNLDVQIENLKYFENGKFKVDFFAVDRVFADSEMFKISNCAVNQNVIGFIGLNASGKTTALRLLKTALNIIIYNTALNLLGLNDMIGEDTIIRITFFL